MANITTTTAAVFIPTILSLEVLEVARANLVAAEVVDKRYSAEAKMGAHVDVPNLAAMTVSQKTADNDWTLSANTETHVSILIDQHWGVAFLVEDIAELQAKQDLRKTYTNRAGYDLAAKIDSTITDLADGASQTVGTMAVALTDSDIRRAVQYLDDANAPRKDRSFLISPATLSDLLDIDKFTRLDYVSSAGKTAVEAAKLNNPIYGADVYVSTQVEGDNTNGHDNWMFQKEHATIILQREPMTHVDYLLKSGGWGVVIDAVWGVKEMRDTYGVWCKGS